MTRVVVFTGHRPDKLGGYNHNNPVWENCRRSLYRALLHLQPTKAISGMALGWDQLGAEACVELGIPFIAAIPFKTQAQMWSREQQIHYKWLLARAQDQIIVSPGGYTVQKMQFRNVWMVDQLEKNRDWLVAGWNGTDGGTKNTLDYARVTEKDILILNPMVPYEQQELPRI